jgi:UDP-GlcNAc:undecaprenyl-phosphate/decaprenyl-phosphate GlcNAc-1-phosphate transferase
MDCGMNSLVTTFSIAFVASLALTVTVRAIAQRLGIVDRPDGKRKLHKTPIASWGGVAVYLAVVLGLLGARYFAPEAGDKFNELASVLIVAAGIVCACGAVDDCWSLNPRFKLSLQICAVLPIVIFGYSIQRIVAFGYPIQLGWLGIPLTIAWLVGCINALNLLDGMDGLASMVGLLTAAMMGIVATNMGNDYVTIIAVVLAGSLAGFLVHNLPPASIFLGDSGSMVIGLIVGVLGIQGAMKTSATLAITVPAVIMSLPIFDTVLAVVRRKLSGRRIDSADHEHIHHRLLDRGLTQWQALCILCALCLATGAAATAATILRSDALAWIIVAALLVLMVRLRLFGNQELALVKQAIARWLMMGMRGKPAAEPKAQTPAAADLASVPFDEAWGMLVKQARMSQVSRLGLTLSCDGEYLHRCGWRDPALTPSEPCRWSIAMTLCHRNGQYCELRAGGAAAMEPASSAKLSDVLKTFAAYFASQSEQVRCGASEGRNAAFPGWDRRGHKQAA